MPDLFNRGQQSPCLVVALRQYIHPSCPPPRCRTDRGNGSPSASMLSPRAERRSPLVSTGVLILQAYMIPQSSSCINFALLPLQGIHKHARIVSPSARSLPPMPLLHAKQAGKPTRSRQTYTHAQTKYSTAHTLKFRDRAVETCRGCQRCVGAQGCLRLPSGWAQLGTVVACRPRKGSPLPLPGTTRGTECCDSPWGVSAGPFWLVGTIAN